MRYERTHAAGRSYLTLLRASIQAEFPDASLDEANRLLKTWLDNGETWRRREPTPPNVVEEELARMSPLVRKAAGLPTR